MARGDSVKARTARREVGTMAGDRRVAIDLIDLKPCHCGEQCVSFGRVRSVASDVLDIVANLVS